MLSPINPHVETPEEVRDRVLEAAEYIPVEQLGTTDDCGFSPFCDDTSTSRDTAFAKIRARVVGTALACRDPGQTLMDSDEQEDERIRVAALENAESIRIARQSYERELLAAKQALERKNEELQQQREWFEVTLASIGDAVITTDVDAKVTYLNPVAESLTGWSSTQAQGQPLERVFRIVNEDTQQTVENPIGKVLQSGRAIGLANHTALIDKNGHLTPIEDSAAPIRAPQGKIVGAVNGLP